MPRVCFKILAFLVVFVGPFNYAMAQRVALVIGNGDYQHAEPLRNPRNDATEIAKALKSFDFEVVEGLDVTRSEMESKIREFDSRLREGAVDIAVLFYAGHGIQAAGQNYLIPTDVKIESEVDLNLKAIPLAVPVNQMEKSAKSRIVFLDACRNNPLANALKTRGIAVGRGLAKVEADVGSLFSFATAPGYTAEDGSGNHSPYTAGLIKHIGTPGIDITAILVRVRNEVLEQTGRQQKTWEDSSLTSEVVFVPGPQDSKKVDLPRWRGRPPINACDRMAAHPYDPEKRAEGVMDRQIDATWALSACAEATRMFPQERRFRFQLARTQHDIGQCENAKKLYEALAVEGHALAINNIGLLYISGCGVAKNEQEAVAYYRRAVEAGSSFAKFSLAHSYEFGKGVAKDEERATQLMSEAANEGFALANLALAGKLIEGRGVPKDEARGVRLVKSAAEAGDAVAYALLAGILDKGELLPKDEAAAARYYRLAGAKGVVRAYFELARMYEAGRGVPKNEAEAASLYRSAVEAGDPSARLLLANMYLEGRGVEANPLEAAQLYQMGVEAGNRAAFLRLAWILEHGRPGVSKNEAEALRLYRKAIELGDTEARLPAALMLYAGRGGPKDEIEAKRLFDEIEKGSAGNDLYHLAQLYNFGLDAPKDESKARQLYRRAVELGHQQSRLALAHMLYSGRGGPKDEIEAKRLFEEIEKGGSSFDLHRLAVAYENGRDAPKDETRARQLYRVVAEKKYAPATIDLARMLQAGKGGPVDLAGAVELIIHGLSSPDRAHRLGIASNVNSRSSSVWTGDFVITLKQKLRSAGANLGRDDAEFGPDLKRAITEFAGRVAK